MSQIVFFENPLLSWKFFIGAAFKSFPDTLLHENLRETIERYLCVIEKFYIFNKEHLKDTIPVSFESKVRFMVTFLRSLIKNNDDWDENDINAIVEYSIVTTFSAAMKLSSKRYFNELWRENWRTYPRELSVSIFQIVSFKDSF